jgi:hypothetical protein
MQEISRLEALVFVVWVYLMFEEIGERTLSCHFSIIKPKNSRLFNERIYT